MMMDGIVAATQQAARRKTGREYTAGANATPPLRARRSFTIKMPS